MGSNPSSMALVSCVTLGKTLSLSGPQFLHLKNGDVNNNRVAMRIKYIHRVLRIMSGT